MAKGEKLIKKLGEFANSNQISLNLERKEFIINRLLENKKNYGEIYCPCRIRTKDKERDKSIICPCIYVLDEVKNKGRCTCNLFIQSF